jgi:hypothetical protein
VSQVSQACALVVSVATHSAALDSLSDISKSERLEEIEGEDGTSRGKDVGACIEWEKDFAGAKLSSVNSASLNGKIPMVEKAEHISSGVIERGCIFIYLGMILYQSIFTWWMIQLSQCADQWRWV